MPLLTLLGQASTVQTIGGTSQLSAFSSSAGLQVGRKIGASSQLAAFTSSGTVTVVSVATAAQGGNYAPTKYVRTKLKKKDEEILESIFELVAKLEESPHEPSPQIKDKVQQVEQRTRKAIKLVSQQARVKEIKNTRAQIQRLTLTVNKHIKKAKDDEDAAINALLELM